MKIINRIIRGKLKDKRIILIIGAIGTGKTRLANHVKKKLIDVGKIKEEDIIIFDDLVHGIKQKRPISEIKTVLASIRHNKKYVIINSMTFPNLLLNKGLTDYVVILFTTINEPFEDKSDVLKKILRDSITKFNKISSNMYKYRYRRKTRSYLLITTNQKKEIKAEINRYNNMNKLYDVKSMMF